MRAKMANRLRSSSLSAVPPPRQSSSYSTDMAKAAVSILYRSPIPSKEGRPVFILNAAAMPDTHETDFDLLLPYVLARLPEEDDLLKGYEYEVVFFAGDGDTGATTKKHRPGWGWFLQAYHVLSRAMRKRLQKLYIVHEKAWVRILTEIFSTIVSPKFRRKIYHGRQLLSSRCVPANNRSLQLDQSRPKHPNRKPPHSPFNVSHRSPYCRRCLCRTRKWPPCVRCAQPLSQQQHRSDTFSPRAARDDELCAYGGEYHIRRLVQNSTTRKVARRAEGSL